MEEKYKDWKIEYKEDFYGTRKEFIATKGSVTLKSGSLHEIRKKADTYKKKNFKRIPCYYNYKESEITSIAEYDRNNNIREVWVSYPDPFAVNKRTRCKAHLGYGNLLKRTDENKKLIDAITKLEVEQRKIANKISTKTDELDKITVGDFEEKIKEGKN